MAKEHWYSLAGAVLVLLPLLLLLAVKKLDLLEIRPNQKIVFKTVRGQELRLHTFKAKNQQLGSPPPALLLFHGGRWKYGSPEAFYPQCQYFAAQGFTCFSAQYRLAPGGSTDVRAAVEDAQSALAYLFANAAELDIDPARVVAGGGSSGGHLAAALGVSLSVRPEQPSATAKRRPAALVLYNPMLDLSPCKPDHHLVKDYWQEVSPYHHIDASVPPSLILLGTEDLEIPVTTAESFCRAVDGAGGRCELALYDGQRHGFFNYQRKDTRYFDMTNRRVVQFLVDLWE